MSRRLALALLLWAYGAATPLHAQAPEATVTQVAAGDVTQSALDRARALFAIYETTHEEGPANQAREILKRVSPGPSHRVEHELLSAIVLARGPDSRMRIGEHANDWFVDPKSLGSVQSLRLLRAVLATEPTHRDAALELATWAIDRDHPLVAAEAEIALAAIPFDAVVLRARAELNLLLGDFGRAASLALLAEAAGADASAVMHLRAYALLQSPATVRAGVEAYYAGARVMSEEGRRVYERTLGPVMLDTELAQWRSTELTGLAALLEQHWQRSAALSGVTHDERLSEHFRRLFRARTEFPMKAPMAGAEIFARYATGVDPRLFGASLLGFMLVRHGDPFALASLPPCRSNPLATPPPECGLLRRRAMRQLARTDSFDPFRREIFFVGDVYAFRGADGGAELVFALTVPARGANALVDASGDVSGLIAAILLPDTGAVIRRDGAFRAPLPDRLDPMMGETSALALLNATIQVAQPDSAYDFRITLSDRDRRAGRVVRGRVDVPSFDGFALSDLAIAPGDVAGDYRRGAFAFALAPYRIYNASETFRLYYEIYGLPAGTPYRTEVELRPARDGALGRMRGLLDRSIRLRFEGDAAQPHPVFGAQELRTVSLDGIEPGVWRLSVVVTDLASGRRAIRETLIDVGPDPAD